MCTGKRVIVFPFGVLRSYIFLRWRAPSEWRPALHRSVPSLPEPRLSQRRSTEQPGNQSLCIGFTQPCGFGGTHSFPLFGGIVFGAGEVVEAVGNVECEFVVDVAAGGAFLDGTVDVNDEISADFAGFAGNGVVAKANDVGGAVLAEVFAVGLGDAFVVDEYDGYFAPEFGRGFGR